MRLYKALNSEVLQDKVFRMGSIILELDNGCILVASDFHHLRKSGLIVRIYSPTSKEKDKWVWVRLKNQYSEMMWDYYRKHQQKRSQDFRKCENMMRHERKHKAGGGGGTRIFNGSITDYECRKDPFHDFRRCWN